MEKVKRLYLQMVRYSVVPCLIGFPSFGWFTVPADTSGTAELCAGFEGEPAGDLKLSVLNWIHSRSTLGSFSS